ncbi:MAG: DUF2262 domain-containing protein [Ruminococcus sp.]|uniref:DUF2262 domain-containing protein n=1 Tax=Ruminococcus sp. TaxID=41978 RepID=UPI0025E0B15F|nr:DUF2262 domain-containing protein [Ruminococcus sp.]MBO4866352.1 DUF2262 domain-containing protein [Ruminococcus sp.]
MTYPIKIGIQEKIANLADREMHEFLVAIGDGHSSALHVGGAETWDASSPILGYIDMDTGRKSSIASSIRWTETNENVKSSAYTKFFEPRTVYRVKGYAYELKEGESYNKWNSGITVSEILMKGEFSSFLAEVYAEWDRAVVMDSEFFGQLVYEKKYDYYEGSFNWLGTQVKIKIDNEEDNAASSLKCAEDLCRNCVEWDIKFKESIADELTYLANDWLRDADEPEITEEEFLSRITMELIDISDYNGGTFYVWYDDGGVFAGHSVTVYGTLEKGVSSVRMEG